MKAYPKYKDSGVQCLGKIPEHWTTCRLKNIGIAQNGISKDSSYFGEGYPFATYGDIYKNQFMPNTLSGLANSTEIDQELYSVKEGDFFFTRTSETVDDIGVSCVCLRTIPQATFSGFLIRVRPHEPRVLNNEFASFYLRSSVPQSFFIREMNIVIRASLSQTLLLSLPMLIPPQEEQKNIALYLSSKTSKIDTYITEKEKEIEALKELKQVEIANAVTHGLNPNAPMKDSGIAWIGQVPEHWEVKRIAISFSENKTKNSNYEFDHAMKFNYGSLVPKNEQGDVSDLKETYIAYTIIEKDDIAINCLNLNYDFVSQRVAIAKQRGILTSAYLIIRPREGVNAEYYNFLFKAMDSKKLFHGMGTGIRLTLSYSDLKKQMIPIPPVDEQSKIVSYVNDKIDKIDTMVSNIQTQISHLKEYKQRLISDVVTGKVDVRDEII